MVQAVFFAERTKAAFGLFSVDWWKAFDRVYIPYLLQVMKKMAVRAERMKRTIAMSQDQKLVDSARVM